MIYDLGFPQSFILDAVSGSIVGEDIFELERTDVVSIDVLLQNLAKFA